MRLIMSFAIFSLATSTAFTAAEAAKSRTTSSVLTTDASTKSSSTARWNDVPSSKPTPWQPSANCPDWERRAQSGFYTCSNK